MCDARRWPCTLQTQLTVFYSHPRHSCASHHSTLFDSRAVQATLALLVALLLELPLELLLVLLLAPLVLLVLVALLLGLLLVLLLELSLALLLTLLFARLRLARSVRRVSAIVLAVWTHVGTWMTSEASTNSTRAIHGHGIDMDMG